MDVKVAGEDRHSLGMLAKTYGLVDYPEDEHMLYPEFAFVMPRYILSCYNMGYMKQVDSIDIAELTEMAKKMYGNLVKGVVDIQKNILILDAEMHVDEEQLLLEQGSKQNDLWGINLYPGKFGQEDFVEFDSMINIRPRQQNMSRGVESPEIRQKIIKLVLKRVKS